MTSPLQTRSTAGSFDAHLRESVRTAVATALAPTVQLLASLERVFGEQQRARQRAPLPGDRVRCRDNAGDVFDATVLRRSPDGRYAVARDSDMARFLLEGAQLQLL